MTKTLEVQVLAPAAKLAVVPKLKSGDDAATAAQLGKLFDDAQTGMRKIVALGLFAWEVKEKQLKHGEFGAWLATHCPKMATIHSVTGRPMASRSLIGYMDLTKSVLESVGFKTIEKFLSTIGKSANAADLGHGQFLLIEDKTVPTALQETREKICALVDGKTQRALFTEFKQAEEDDEGNLKTKRGALKGSKGLTKEQRARAAERAETARIAELEEQAGETASWIVENSDDKNIGQIDGRILRKLEHALAVGAAYVKKVIEARKQ